MLRTGSGLLGSLYFSENELFSLTDARSLLSQTPDTTFNATLLDYGAGTGWSHTSIPEFLGADAAGLSDPDLALGVDNMAMKLAGYICLEAGTYRFDATTDDGFELALGGQVLTAFEGQRAALTSSGEITLSGGLYPIEILYFDAKGGSVFDLEIARDGGPAQPLGSSALYAGPEDYFGADATVTIGADGPLETYELAQLAELRLIFSDTDEETGIVLTDGVEVDATLVEGRPLSIVAVPLDGHRASVRIEQVRFSFESATLKKEQTENVEPYALFGDRKGDYKGRLFGEGSHSITAELRDGSGNVLETLNASFSIRPAITPLPTSLSDDTLLIFEDEAASLDVLANDSGEGLALSDVFAAIGDVFINADGTITYKPLPDYFGADVISYSVTDAMGMMATAMVAVTVAAVNDAPVAVPDLATAQEGTAQPIAVLANDIDPDGDPLSISSVSAAQNGTLVINADETITYTPTEGFHGADFFEYQVSDGNGGTEIAKVEVTVEAAAPSGPVLAFAGAEGFGKFAVGGREGEILKVTNLDDDGVGSLRWALEDFSGPRFVVFEVGGVIRLSREINVSDPYVTVAGQTALGEGVTITGARIKVNADEVIIRGLKMRPGDGIDGQEFANRDGISIGGGGSSDPIRNIVLDSNSMTWATDENTAIWGNVSDVTISNNIIAQGLETPTEPGRASMGMIAAGGVIERLTISKNFFAHNEDRNPFVRDATDLEIVNNYVYNYGASGMRLSGSLSANIVGNFFEAGVNSPDRAPVYLNDSGAGASSYHLSGNEWMKNGVLHTGNEVAHTSIELTTDQMLFQSNVDALSAEAVKKHVLSNAGARASSRDDIDTYLVDTAWQGTGSAIDRLEELPVRLDVSSYFNAPADSDSDGIPDWFEEMHKAFDSLRFDAHDDADRDGYTNIEEYVNGLIDGFDMG